MPSHLNDSPFATIIPDSAEKAIVLSIIKRVEQKLVLQVFQKILLFVLACGKIEENLSKHNS